MRTWRFRDVLRSPETDRKKVRFDVEVPTNLSELINDLPPTVVPSALGQGTASEVTNKTTESLQSYGPGIENYVAVAGSFVPTTYAGYYRVHCQLQATCETTLNTNLVLRLKKNGTTFYTVSGSAAFVFGYVFVLTADYLVLLTSGDVIEASIQVSTNPGPVNVTLNSVMSITYEAAP